MITQKELHYIYNNWKKNQYLFPLMWGMKHSTATPIYYLAKKRGIKFHVTNKVLSIQSLPIIYNDNIHLSVVYIHTLYKDWSDFLQYNSFDDYYLALEKENTEVMKYTVLDALEKAIENISITRIYTL